MSTESTPTPGTSTVEPPFTTEFSTAYHKHLPDMLAVKDDELIPINLDPRAIVFTVLGSLPEIRKYESTIRELPKYPLASFENLEGYAQALYYAHAIQLGAFAPDDEVVKLYLENTHERDVLLADATALAKRDLIPAKQVESFKGMSGYKNVSSDVIGLAEVLEAHWPAIEGKTALTRAELQQAKQNAERLVRVASIREQSPAVVADAQLNRQRAYTLTVRAWDAVRRAIAFIRWDEGDLDRIAPSLWSGRGGRGKAEQAATAKTEIPAPVAKPTEPAAAAPAVASNALGGSPFVS